MNYLFYEQRSNEKVNNLLDEGQRSQAVYRSGAKRLGVTRNLLTFVGLLVGVLGLILLIVL